MRNVILSINSRLKEETKLGWNWKLFFSSFHFICACLIYFAGVKCRNIYWWPKRLLKVLSQLSYATRLEHFPHPHSTGWKTHLIPPTGVEKDTRGEFGQTNSMPFFLESIYSHAPIYHGCPFPPLFTLTVFYGFSEFLRNHLLAAQLNLRCLSFD